MASPQVLVLVGRTPDDWAQAHFATADIESPSVCVATAADAYDSEADILVVAPSVVDPLAQARAFRQRRPSGQILFVVSSASLERIQRTLPFSPEISEAWVIDEDVSESDLLRHLREAGAAVASRRAVKGLYSRINAHFGQAPRAIDEDGARQTRHMALAERYLTAILANAPDALFATTLDGDVVSWNETAARLFRRSWDEISGRSFLQLFLPADRETAASLLEQARMGESVRTQELRIPAGDGTVTTLDVASGPVLGGGGAIEGVSMIARDITTRKRDEAALRQLNDELESRVVKAVAEREVTAAALRQAQKMEAVGQLTGGVAHDFNNLLTVIKSSIELLRRPDLAEERKRRYVDAISDTVDRATKLTGQLLAFARRQPLKPEVFDAAENVRSVSEMLATIVGSRINIVTEIGCETCFVHADTSQFQTALVNMGVNARDAMNGEGTLTLAMAEVAAIPSLRGHHGATGDFIAVSVTDTGCGIPQDKLGQIFEPFFTTKELGKGTGLGLSQVFGFAKQSGGDIDVASRTGVGTIFTLYLPRVEHQVDEPIVLSDAASPTTATGSVRRILVVEDNVEVGKFTTQILEDLGHRITWAANAAEAIAFLTENSERFDIVFSDVVMPGMNGIELGKIIREEWPGLPVVLASGYSHVLAEEGRHGFELVQKPYATSDISRVLTRMARSPAAGTTMVATLPQLTS